ncbi:hypothetical protein M513_02998 [Trichuris suis]|uniref:Uncharacterized protein n=1 Tax=Trichuris suis TaxID=68888 RepID=A0A085MG74_9BILA|nr:hypothetical protein M513_02998 [Trichuris suis]
MLGVLAKLIGRSAWSSCSSDNDDSHALCSDQTDNGDDDDDTDRINREKTSTQRQQEQPVGGCRGQRRVRVS